MMHFLQLLPYIPKAIENRVIGSSVKSNLNSKLVLPLQSLVFECVHVIASHTFFSGLKIKLWFKMYFLFTGSMGGTRTYKRALPPPFSLEQKDSLHAVQLQVVFRGRTISYKEDLIGQKIFNI